MIGEIDFSIVEAIVFFILVCGGVLYSIIKAK